MNKIKFKDIIDFTAVESDEFPRLDDEVYDLQYKGKTVIKGVSGRDYGLSSLFWSYFNLKDDESPTPKQMAAFRINKLFGILSEAIRLAKEFDVEFDGELHFTGKRNHPHTKLRAEGDKIVRTTGLSKMPDRSKPTSIPDYSEHFEEMESARKTYGEKPKEEEEGCSVCGDKEHDCYCCEECYTDCPCCCTCGKDEEEEE